MEKYNLLTIAEAFKNNKEKSLYGAHMEAIFDGVGIDFNWCDVDDKKLDTLEKMIKTYPYDTWIDCDTLVGIFLHTLDDKPLAISNIYGGKSYTNIWYSSDNEIKRLKKLYDEVSKKKEYPIINFSENFINKKDNAIDKLK